MARFVVVVVLGVVVAGAVRAQLFCLRTTTRVRTTLRLGSSWVDFDRRSLTGSLALFRGGGHATGNFEEKISEIALRARQIVAQNRINKRFFVKPATESSTALPTSENTLGQISTAGMQLRQLQLLKNQPNSQYSREILTWKHGIYHSRTRFLNYASPLTHTYIYISSDPISSVPVIAATLRFLVTTSSFSITAY